MVNCIFGVLCFSTVPSLTYSEGLSAQFITKILQLYRADENFIEIFCHDVRKISHSEEEKGNFFSSTE